MTRFHPASFEPLTFQQYPAAGNTTAKLCTTERKTFPCYKLVASLFYLTLFFWMRRASVQSSSAHALHNIPLLAFSAHNHFFSTLKSQSLFTSFYTTAAPCLWLLSSPFAEPFSFWRWRTSWHLRHRESWRKRGILGFFGGFFCCCCFVLYPFTNNIHSFTALTLQLFSVNSGKKKPPKSRTKPETNVFASCQCCTNKH